MLSLQRKSSNLFRRIMSFRIEAEKSVKRNFEYGLVDDSTTC